jgi:hypothetical protein
VFVPGPQDPTLPVERHKIGKQTNGKNIPWVEELNQEKWKQLNLLVKKSAYVEQQHELED